jgi:hypothetical protein
MLYVLLPAVVFQGHSIFCSSFLEPTPGAAIVTAVVFQGCACGGFSGAFHFLLTVFGTDPRSRIKKMNRQYFKVIIMRSCVDHIILYFLLCQYINIQRKL